MNEGVFESDQVRRTRGPRLMPHQPASPASETAPARRALWPKRVTLFFSEPLANVPQGVGCVTFPVDAVLAPSKGDPPCIYILDVPKAPVDMPVGELQVDPAWIALLQDAGYACCPMPRQTMAEYWAAARGRPVKHWHPRARLVQY